MYALSTPMFLRLRKPVNVWFVETGSSSVPVASENPPLNSSETFPVTLKRRRKRSRVPSSAPSWKKVSIACPNVAAEVEVAQLLAFGVRFLFIGGDVCFNLGQTLVRLRRAVGNRFEFALHQLDIVHLLLACGSGLRRCAGADEVAADAITGAGFASMALIALLSSCCCFSRAD